MLKLMVVLSSTILCSCGENCVDFGLTADESFEFTILPSSAFQEGTYKSPNQYRGTYGTGELPTRDNDSPLQIYEQTARRYGELYNGCVTIGKNFYMSFKDGLPIYSAEYEEGFDNPRYESNYKKGLLHGKFYRRTIQFYDDKNESRIEWKDSLLVLVEGSFFNGLKNGEWSFYNIHPGTIYLKDAGKSWIGSKEYWDMGKKVGTWTEYKYTGQMEEGDKSGIKLETYRETVFYRGLKHYEIGFEADGKFIDCRIWGEWDSGRYGIPHYFRLKDFPDYDGYGSLEFLNKYIEEGKTQIDELIGENGLVKT